MAEATEYTIEEEGDEVKAAPKKPKEGDFKVKTRTDYENSVAKDYVPEGFDSVEAFLRDMREKYEADIDADDDNRKEAIDDKKFAAGEQWDPLVLEHRKGLPNLVINSVPQFTAQLVGDWRQNRNGIKVLPSEDGDVDVAKIRGDLVRSIETKNRAHRVYDQAFESTVQCGDGAFRIAVDYVRDDVFEQEIKIKPIEDCLSVVWDHLSTDPTGKDANHVFVDDSIPKKEFERKWGKELSPSTLNSDDQRDLRTNGWYDGQTVRITEYWRMIERMRTLLMFEDGFVIAMDEKEVEDDEKLGELLETHGPVVRSRLAPCLYAQMHLVTGHAILDGPYEYKINRVPIIRSSGRIVNVAGRRVRYGLVRFMKDAVRLRNFWRSIAAEQLGYAPKAQWIGPESAFEGREDEFRKAHQNRDPILTYNDDAVAPPERVQPPVPETALHQEAAVNAQDMKDVTGIHDASLGIRSNETSGKAINARQREGDIASFTFFDNANEAILEAGDVINQLIPQIYDSTRIIRTVGEDEELRMVRINDPNDPEAVDLGKGTYDVTLSTGTSFQTRRVEAAEAMMNAVQVWPEIMSIAGDLVVKAQDWPGAEKLAERLKKAMPPELQESEEGDGPPPIPPQVQQAMQEMQAALQEFQKENEELKADRSVNQFEAETKRLKVLLDAGLEEEELSQKATELGLKTAIEAFKLSDTETGNDKAAPTGNTSANQ